MGSVGGSAGGWVERVEIVALARAHACGACVIILDVESVSEAIVTVFNDVEGTFGIALFVVVIVVVVVVVVGLPGRI